MSKGNKDPQKDSQKDIGHERWKDLKLKDKLATLLAAAVAIVAIGGIGGAWGLSKLGDAHDNGVEKDITTISEQFADNKADVCSWDAAGLRVRDWKGEITVITHGALDEIKPDAEGIIQTLKRIATSYEPDKDVFRDKMQTLADMGIGICFDNQLPPDMPSAYYPDEKLITLNPQAPDEQLARLLAFHFDRLANQTAPDTKPVGLALDNNTATPHVKQAPANLPRPPLRGRALKPA